MFMAIARTVSLRGTCYRLNVGGIVVLNDRDIIGIGYNGAPADEPHCTGNGCKYFEPTGCQVLHGEANAIRRAQAHAGEGIMDAWDVYCTHSPCAACVQVIMDEQRILHVYYETEYRDRTPIERLLRESTIGVAKVLPSGLIVDQRSGDIRDA